ncbi:MAG TPA: ArdC family protein [Candidatus Sulfotelmatobacter sp.]
MKLEEIKNKTNEAVSYLVAALESGESEVLTQYLNAMARFHHYSFGNIMLIARQKPQATNVAGIRTWNSLGRFVKRGEKGILILAPMVGYRKPGQNEVATDIDTDNTETSVGQKSSCGPQGSDLRAGFSRAGGHKLPDAQKRLRSDGGKRKSSRSAQVNAFEAT